MLLERKPGVEVMNALLGLATHRRPAGYAKPAISTKETARLFLRAGFRPKKIQDKKFSVDNLDSRVEQITSARKPVCERAGLAESESRFLLALVKHHLAVHSTTARRHQAKDFVVVGSPCELGDRIIAAEARRAGEHVISIIHGRAYGHLDEPIFGYGENTFPDEIVSLGTTSTSAYRMSKHLSSYLEPLQTPVFHDASDEVVLSMQAQSSTSSTNSGRSPTFLYIPTSYAGPRHYGPYRYAPERVYLAWQQLLCNNREYIHIKFHPKERRSRWLDIDPSRVAEGRIEDIASDYDGFIFDYISSDSSEILATRKPMVMFDLGIRQIHPEAMSYLRKRIHWVDVTDLDSLDIDGELHAALRSEASSEFSERYSLDPDRQTQREVLIRILAGRRG